jgi:hypothetical protein
MADVGTTLAAGTLSIGSGVNLQKGLLTMGSGTTLTVTASTRVANDITFGIAVG